MCGLSGIIALKTEGLPFLEKISASLESIIHRGPDHQSIHRGNNFAVCHARLSILDLSAAAHQPFFSRDKRAFLLHNGEIFNYRILRDELQAKGEVFTSQSDTEVIEKCFLTSGVSAFEKLDGFFATVIAEPEKHCWHLARDPYGVKPLYYYSDDKIFAFSSEMQGLLALGIERQPDWDSIFTYFQLNYIPQPWTALKNVRQVRPGHCLRVDTETSTVEEISYYPSHESESFKTNTYREGNELKTFEHLFGESVKKRMIADVPVGAFLSGGLDSTAVVSVAAALHPNLETFSIGFTDDPYYNETRYAEEVARIFKTEHQTLSMKTSDMLDVIPGVLEHCSEPFGDSSAIAVYLLSQKVGEKIKVALSGDGSDELLGGYNKHRAEVLFTKYEAVFRSMSFLKPLSAALPQGRHKRSLNTLRKFNRLLDVNNLSPEERYWHWCSFMPESEVKELVVFEKLLTAYAGRKKELLKGLGTNEYELNNLLSTDLRLVLQSDMLVKADRMSMANALEVRSPFLDHELVRFCSSLPVKWKIRGNTSKYILREFLKGKVPDHIIHRKKQGFEVPLHRWLTGELKETYLKELFHEDFIQQQSIFEPRSIRNLLKRLNSGNPGDTAMQVWGLLVFQYWWKKYL
ncbi:MAG: asparagine synthase (glutamine-hydrolyzing) [Bacteroidales bacterium]